jgi:alkanesulfonate monooxygenase SsuD/methylene tetrahydromethanopterin reductase-like flavin-dependent oxidoreductase (luciferase family)
MKSGVFCVYENFSGSIPATMARQTRLIQHAESLGFDQAWIAEHHFDPFLPSPSILALLAHLAGKTRRIRLGTAALILPFHDPVKVAEDVATIDILSEGRVDLGVARGGPFPLQNLHFGVVPEEARARTLEALDAIIRLWREENVAFSGRYLTLHGMTLFPRPLQAPIPVYLATADQDGVTYAAQHGHGLLGSSMASLSQLKQVVTLYRRLNPGGSDRFTPARFMYVADTRARAREQAEPFLERLEREMHGARHRGESHPPHYAADEQTALDETIIGDVQECRDRLLALRDELKPDCVLVRLASLDPEACLRSLTLYRDQVLPYV